MERLFFCFSYHKKYKLTSLSKMYVGDFFSYITREQNKFPWITYEIVVVWTKIESN